MKKKPDQKTKSTPVFLDDEQREWLRQQPSGISGTVRALVFEAMNLDNLAKSLKRKKSNRPSTIAGKARSRDAARGTRDEAAKTPKKKK